MVRFFAFLIWLLATTFPIFSAEEDTEDIFVPSTPDQIASLSSQEELLIGGIISPLSGQPALRRTDLLLKGAQSISLDRVYIPPSMPCSFPKREKHQHGNWETYCLCEHLKNNYRGWQYFPHLLLRWDPKSGYVHLNDSSGMTLVFRGLGKDPIYRFRSPPYAISNFSGNIPSGKSDPRNARLSKNDGQFIVNATDGTVRFYNSGYPNRDGSWNYLLNKEILPNGKVLKYHFKDYDLETVESVDPRERHVYASLRINGSPYSGAIQFVSSAGQTVNYIYERRNLHIKIWKKENRTERDFLCPPILTSVSSPFFRDETLHYADPPLLENYTGKDEIFLCGYRGFGTGVPHYRVYQLFFPVGPQEAFHPLYNISYDPPIAGQKDGSTTVKNSDGTLIVYHFSKNYLPTLIRFFGPDGVLNKEKTFAWTGNESMRRTGVPDSSTGTQWLQAIEVKDGHNHPLFKKSYEYDRFGNPTLEVFYGDLTGNGQWETYTTKRIFSDDGRHLLRREETEDGKVVCYSYLPNTNLITSKLTHDREKIILREFSEYDDCNNLIRTINDDGICAGSNDLAGVTERKITYYILRQQQPYLHMPEWVEEKYLEQGQEKLLRRTHLDYDQFGNVKQEDIYDANGEHVYTLLKEYNERGTLLSETNALGHKKIYTDDDRGRIASTTNFSNRLTKTFRYDPQGRVREQTEKGDDGIVHSTFLDYDYNDRLKQKIDLFQNTTQYDYDPLVNKIVKTEFPPIASPTGEAVRVVTHSAYDTLGNEIAKTDANSHSTFYRYNAYGSVTEITHPDRTKESLRYEKNGALASYTDPDGLTTTYKRDILGRVLSKTYFFNSQQIAEEIFTYNGFHLLTETDKEGHVTEYRYDGAGRKIQESRCGRVIEFGYNSLGQLATICKHNKDNTLYIHYRRDYIDRVEEETKTDASGQLFYIINYTYDPDGNVKTVIRNINGNDAPETFTYDSLGRLIDHTDALGYTDRTVYDENQLNALDQRVLKISHIDPCCIASVKIYDTQSRLVKKETINSQGQTLSSQEKIYDPAGNLTYHREHVYQSCLFKNTQTVEYTYTPNDQIASLTKAYGTQNARSTTYTYHPSGKLATKTLPSGVALSYSYDPLGFMERLDSSDGNIGHFFEHNLIGHLLSATDKKQNFSIQRKVDPFGNVIREEFPCGLTIEKDYDAFNRPTLIKIEGVGEIHNEYNALSLKSVTRYSNQGEALYSHRYDEYDLSGNLVAESLIGNSGQVIHGTDLIRQRTSIASPYFSQNCSYDPCGNLFRSVLDHDQLCYTYDSLSQLASESSYLYAYDSVYNRVQKNKLHHQTNALNELTDHSYDLNGNQSLKNNSSETFVLVHDPLNRLIEATSAEKTIQFVYDPLGRRLSKTIVTKDKNETENYLYDGNNEIGAFTQNNVLKNLKILGLANLKNDRSPIAIELEGQIFAPILDIQGNIRRLVSIDSGAIAGAYDFSAFGEEISAGNPQNLVNPWRFASKRLDTEFGLIYFGKRYYDPEHGRWIETDPAGFLDSINLYQYVFNNPFKFTDPTGEFVFMIPILSFAFGAAGITFGTITTTQAIAITATAAAMWVGSEVYKHRERDRLDRYSARDDYAQYVMKTEKAEEEEKKKKPPYSGEDLAKDPSKSPGEGFEWRGKGSPESGKGNWVNESTGEKFYPDLEHPPPKQPHWDYTSPEIPKGVRLNIDGSWEYK